MQQKATEISNRLKHMTYERLRALRLFNLEKKSLRRSHISLYKYLMGGVNEMEPDCSQQ